MSQQTESDRQDKHSALKKLFAALATISIALVPISFSLFNMEINNNFYFIGEREAVDKAASVINNPVLAEHEIVIESVAHTPNVSGLQEFDSSLGNEYYDGETLRLDYPSDASRPEQVRILRSDGVEAASFWSHDSIETTGKGCFMLQLRSINPPLSIGTRCEVPAGVHVVPDDNITMENIDGKNYIVFKQSGGKLRVYR